ncbi:MAG: hypothetical protein COB14_07675 [Alphaproteobacteria bacterium]|nr:MAG: hypothetical protein COB14_07675 [Alphaproteobacteria bacterium]
MKSQKIVITRPEEQGRAFVERLEGCNSSEFLLEPLLDIQFLSVSLPDSNSYDGVILTSIHSVDIFHSADPSWLEMSFYCVGESVAAALRDRGAKNISLIAPMANELVQKIREECGCENAHLLYLRGKDIAFDVKDALKDTKIKIDELVCYEAITETKFSDTFIQALNNHEIAAITFFSKRTALAFLECVRASNVENNLKGIKALCISDGVLECLHSVFGQNIVVSDTPDADGMSRITRFLSE